jgi:4-amino-4-deoxy-L-arabinose transferase-like glycosyltransferase
MHLPLWAKPRFVFLAIVVYLVAHLAIRMAMGPALSTDDAEQALLSQQFAWAYRYKAPPLFNWMLTALDTVVPVSAFSIGLLRYALLGVLYVFMYLAARRLLTDPRLSALSVFSFAALNPFAEASHRNLTHSTTLTAVAAVSWYVFLRLAEAPHLGWYLALGGAFGLGMLAKWNFVLLAVALPIACLLSRDHRPLVLTWKIVPAAILATVIVLPTVIATLDIPPPADDRIETVLDLGAGLGMAQVIEGTLRLLHAAIVFSLPFLPLAAIVFAPSLWRAIRGRSAGAPLLRFPPRTAPIGLTIAVGMVFLWSLVLFAGATDFKVRYLYPVLLILPVWFFLIVAAGRPSDRSISVFALLLVALAVFVAGKRIAQATGLASCGLCGEWQPYRDLADQLRQAGYQGGGTVLTDLATGGNLRVQFPGARVLDPLYPLASGPRGAGDGQCLILFGDSQDELAHQASLGRFASYLAGPLSGSLDAPHRAGVVSAPMLPPAKGSLGLAYRLYEGPDGDCR